MFILLTNDDGISAPGLSALERELRRLGEVCVAAPATEQSGAGHSITYLTPLMVKEAGEGRWMVDGSPADCVRIAVAELCPRRPDLVVSGINHGLNVGINILYSGTVAAAVEGAFFGIPSVAVSLEFAERPRFDLAARLAERVIRQLIAERRSEPQLYNLNIPTAALTTTPAVKTVPMDAVHHGERFDKRLDPWGRAYYWSAGSLPRKAGERETDCSVTAEGNVALTPLHFDMTRGEMLNELRSQRFDVAGWNAEANEPPNDGPTPTTAP